MIDDDRGAISGMNERQGKPEEWREPAPVLLCPSHIQQVLTFALTWATAVEIWRLTTWPMIRSEEGSLFN
jgi:hypothetical protein